MTPLLIRFDDTVAPAVLHVGGELDIATAPQLRSALTAAMGDGRVVQIDFAELDFIDAAGMRALLEAAEGLNGSGPLTIVNGERVARLLALVGLSGVPSLDLREEGAVHG